MYGLIHGPFTDEYKRSHRAHIRCVMNTTIVPALLDTPELFVYKIAKITGSLQTRGEMT